MRNYIKNFIVFILAIIVSVAPVTRISASAKTDTYKMLVAYKNGNYEQAKRYAKKVPDKVSKVSIKNLSAKEKEAFQRKILEYTIEGDSPSIYKNMWSYYLADLDGDKKAELLIRCGTCEADVKMVVYQYQKGKAKKVGEFGCAHSRFYTFPGRGGIIYLDAYMCVENLNVVTLKNGKLNWENIGSREIKSTEKYLQIHQELYGHIEYGEDYSSRWINFKDLK